MWIASVAPMVHRGAINGAAVGRGRSVGTAVGREMPAIKSSMTARLRPRAVAGQADGSRRIAAAHAKVTCWLHDRRARPTDTEVSGLSVGSTARAGSWPEQVVGARGQSNFCTRLVRSRVRWIRRLSCR